MSSSPTWKDAILNLPVNYLRGLRKCWALPGRPSYQIDLPKDAHLDRVQVRITELPGHFRIGQLNSAHIDRLIAIEGRVVKADKARSRRVSSAVFLCLRCGNVFLQDLTRVDRADPEIKVFKP